MHFEDNKPADRQHRKGRASSRQFLKLPPPAELHNKMQNTAHCCIARDCRLPQRIVLRSLTIRKANSGGDSAAAFRIKTTIY